MIHHMSRSMAGGVDDIELVAAQLQLLAVGDVTVGLAWGNFDRQRKRRARLLELGFVQLVDKNFGDGEARGYQLMVGDMIEMAVGEPQADDLPAFLVGMVEERRRGVIGGIEKDSDFFNF